MTLKETIRIAEDLLPGEPAPDDQEDPRWQAIIAISEFIESNPDEVWHFAAKWGSHPDDDVRSAVATCLVEHLLEDHFDLIFPRVERLAMQNLLFADTFTRCAKFGQAEMPENSRKYDALDRACSERSR